MWPIPATGPRLDVDDLRREALSINGVPSDVSLCKNCLERDRVTTHLSVSVPYFCTILYLPLCGLRGLTKGLKSMLCPHAAKAATGAVCSVSRVSYICYYYYYYYFLKMSVALLVFFRHLDNEQCMCECKGHSDCPPPLVLGLGNNGKGEWLWGGWLRKS